MAIQIIRPARTNPPIDPSEEISAVHAVSPQVRAILARSCYDCHSNRTIWPWYSDVAPSSWLVSHDVTDGRAKMNLSEWTTYPDHKRFDLLKDICEKVTEGRMPISVYLLLHPAARLTAADRQALCRWTKTPERTTATRHP